MSIRSKILLKIFVYFTSIKIILTNPSKICNFLNGDRGICVNPRNCPHVNPLNTCSIDCNSDTVCCPTFISSSSTLNLCTFSSTSDPLTTARPPDSSIAMTKCIEYKSRVREKLSIITYVFGGTEAKRSEFPHMAALGYGQPGNPDWLCGGSLISEQYVITAAQCVVYSSSGSLVVVRLGDLNLRNNFDDEHREDFSIAQTILHPQYHFPQQYNDIALIKLDRVVNFNQYIAPICLQTSYVLPNMDFTATGWGRTEVTGQPSETLRKVRLSYFPNSLCHDTFAQVSQKALPNSITDYNQICAGSYVGEKDICQGDVGGPLQIKNNTTWVLVGITSFGLACGIPNSPAVYTRVSYFVSWIEKIVWS